MQHKIGRFTEHLFGQLFIALILGAIQVFSFAPFNHYWVVYPSFVGFFLLLQQIKKTTKRYFLISFIFNLSMFVATLHWIYVSMDQFGGMPPIVSASLIVLLSAYLAIYPTLALWISYRFFNVANSLRYLLLIPVMWLTFDWLRGWALTGFPWGYLGYSHADTYLVGFAPILGVQGITLAILLICSALTLIIQKQKIIVNVVLICSLLLAGQQLQTLNFTQPQAAVKVSLVQGNIDQNDKWNKKHLYPSLFKYLDLSETPFAVQDELIIWPESAIAALEVDMQTFLLPLSEDLKSRNKTLITGIISYNLDTEEYHNSIIALGKLPKGDGYSLSGSNRYQKHQLLPIGEFVPFEDLLRPLAPYFNLPMSSFQRGDEIQTNLKTNQSRFASALCYEIVFPELLRQNISSDTGMLLTLSNDAWFTGSIGPEQHLQIARMRAIEFARPILRSTNNGVTAIYDHKGKELGRLPVNSASVLSQEVSPTFGKTPYQTFGSTPLHLYCLLILSGFLFYTKIQRQKGPR